MDVCTLETTSLLDLISNPIIGDNIYRYLPRSTIFRLARTSKIAKDLVLNTSKVFRYLDLTNCKGAYTPAISRIDHGGYSWRAERMDENLTEDEFLSGPLRHVLNQCSRLKILQDIQVLVLDGLRSVTHDLIFDIVSADTRYKVKLLSIRNCPNINHSQLQRLLTHICRPSRPEGTPRLEGLYLFTDPAFDHCDEAHRDLHVGVTTLDGATLGIVPSEKAQTSRNNANAWYTAAGQVICVGHDDRTSWEETLQTCEGIIAFDAVLCRAMHNHAAVALHEASKDALNRKPGILPIATVSLGQAGCAGCGLLPEDTPVWGKSEFDQTRFPLLAPPPWTGRLVDALRPTLPVGTQASLNVSCKWCLVNRHCDSCQRWWCVECYSPKGNDKLKNLENLNASTEEKLIDVGHLSYAPNSRQRVANSIKVFNGFCVEQCLVGEMMASAGSNGMWA